MRHRNMKHRAHKRPAPYGTPGKASSPAAGAKVTIAGPPIGRGNPAGQGPKVTILGPPVGRGAPAGKAASVNVAGPPTRFTKGRALANLRKRRKFHRVTGRNIAPPSLPM